LIFDNPNNTKTMKKIARFTTGLAALVLLLALSSCSHLMYLDSAQQNFNRAAALDNEMRFSPRSEVPASPSLYYSTAHAFAEKALQNKSALKKDDVLANAYSIKALSEWKLYRYDEAKATSRLALLEYQALEEDKKLFMPRDKALMEALPSLTDLDQGKRFLYTFFAGTMPGYEQAKDHYFSNVFHPDADKSPKLETAVSKIDMVRSQLEGNNDLALYFVSSQLAGLKTWSDALDFLRQSANKDNSLSDSAKQEARAFVAEQYKLHIKPQKEKLLADLSRLAPKPEAERMKSYWDDLF